MAARFQVVVRGAASRDAYRVVSHYGETGPNLALRFFDDFKHTGKRLGKFPLIRREALPPIRRFMLDHFPYYTSPATSSESSR